ncbi:MAG: hypothetical protein K8963_04095 [Proteobacteria bacterium]|nr:hypothetical protein [Pseudomonadota bacterium]
MFSLLKDGLFRVRLKDSSASELSLPQVYEAMSRDEVSAFVALRPHQRHAWHAFLAQLGAMACHQAGIAKPPTAATEWHKLIQSLTPDFPDDEPWCLLVDDLSKPAFMQSPLAGELAEYKNTARAPDDIDVLVTSKNHDVKQSVALTSKVDDWIFALICLQTMSGFMGRGNYGIARMNGGSSSRPCLGLCPSEGGIGAHLMHDIAGMLSARERICNDYPDYYSDRGPGHKLLWVLPWQGKSSECLSLKELDVYFVEISRRLRLVLSEDELLQAKVGNSDAVRVHAKEACGNTGDYWTPVITKGKDVKSYTLSEVGFSYKQLKKILFELGHCRPAPAMNIPSCPDTSQWRLVARGYAGGQGKTEGYHERNNIILDGKTTRTFTFGFDNADRKQLAEISENVIKEIEFIRKALSSAIGIVASGGQDLALVNKSHREHAEEFFVRLEDFANTLFFSQVQKRFTAQENEGAVAKKLRLEFLCLMIMYADQLLTDAIGAVPCAGIFRYRAAVKAKNAFFGRLYGPKSEFADLSANIKAEINARRGKPAPKNTAADPKATAA